MIKKVDINNRKKCIEIDTSKGTLALPFLKLRVVPTLKDKIRQIYVDEELGNMAVTYILESGQEDTVHLDAFLDYNKDPDYMTRIILYKLTLKAVKLTESSNLPKREIARILKTSPAQLYRLLDTTNYSKSIDQMVKLVVALGYEVGFVVTEKSDQPENFYARLRHKFPHLGEEELRTTPAKSTFKPLLYEERQAA